MRVLSYWQSGLIAAAAAWVATPAAGTDWVQFNFDPSHSGVNPSETVLFAGNVRTLHVLYHVTLPSIADGAPVFLGGVTTTQGKKDLLFLTTKAGHILALDASNGAVVWSRQPASSPNYTTSSPAIDFNRQYVYSYGLEGAVHKYQVANGAEITGAGWPQVTTHKPNVEKGASALAIATAQDGNNYLYVTNGGYPGDAGDYQGHVTAINLSTGAQSVFNANCSDQRVHFVTGGGLPDCPHVQSAIWARPGVVYASYNDRIYMATGNGTFDANTGGHDWGDSVFALPAALTAPAAAGLTVPLDSYTPTEFQQLQNADADLGSTAPAILPVSGTSNVPHLAVQSGKDAQIRLLNMDNLSSAPGMPTPGRVGGELQKIAVPQGGGVLSQPAVWVNPADGSTWTFIANGSGISGLQLMIDGVGNPSLVARWTKSPGGTSPVVANGILYHASPSGLRARDPTTGNQIFVDSSIGPIHWQSPIVVNGKVYVTDENAQLWAYGPALASIPAINLLLSSKKTQGN